MNPQSKHEKRPREGPRREEGAAVEDPFFRGWFNNHMALVVMMIQHVAVRRLRTVIRAEFFLEDVEHHFMPVRVERRVGNAFRYLRCYFRVYPYVSMKHSKKANEMVARIYHALGLEFDLPFQPVTSRAHPIARSDWYPSRRRALYCDDSPREAASSREGAERGSSYPSREREDTAWSRRSNSDKVAGQPRGKETHGI